MKRKIIIFLFSLLAIFILVFLNMSVANPTSWPFYDFKRLYEKTQLSLRISPREKLNYQYGLLDKRLAELAYVVENRISPQVLNTSLRYSTTVGQITELIVKNNLTDEVPTAKEKFNSQLAVIKNLINRYPKDDSEAKFIIDDANYLQVYVDQLSSFENAKK